MNKRVSLFFLLFAFLLGIMPARAQSNRKSRISKKDSKWPYFGEVVPRYLALAAGYEGLKTNNFQIGVMLNAYSLDVTPAIGAMLGGGLFYKQNADNVKLHSYEAEFGMYAGFVLGLNYNYNITPSSEVHGLKPFIGIAVYNAQLFYGYCFYNPKGDPSDALGHNRITVRYVIPFFRFKKRTSELNTQ